VLLGLAAARLAVGRGEEAAAELDAILTQIPFWLQGHVQLAQLRAVLGLPERAMASLERALAAFPAEYALWRCLFDLLIRREDFHGLVEALARAASAGQPPAVLAEHKAIAASESGDIDRADALFEAAPPASQESLALWRVRHLLRAGRPDDASALIDRALAGGDAAWAWPYAATAWRLTGDPRGAWLEGEPRLIATIDLRAVLPPLDRVAALLRSLHVAKGEYLDQSVRGGTQTDGPLFSRMDPEIRSLRSAVVGAVQTYLAQLPPPDPSHPLLAPRRNRRIRFAGSWSVRLRNAGYHANHVHPQGWISSALYISLPERCAHDPPEAGWLTLGEPTAALGLALPPTSLVEPQEGQLVLFPSWMWHGTRPFPAGERLTVAFDVAAPA
jgi:tetratricopeptide (TPR) repeat protein